MPSNRLNMCCPIIRDKNTVNIHLEMVTRNASHAKWNWYHDFFDHFFFTPVLIQSDCCAKAHLQQDVIVFCTGILNLDHSFLGWSAAVGCTCTAEANKPGWEVVQRQDRGCFLSS